MEDAALASQARHKVDKHHTLHHHCCRRRKRGIECRIAGEPGGFERGVTVCHGAADLVYEQGAVYDGYAGRGEVSGGRGGGG